ncbi:MULTISPECIES: hypothetical protein [unclassified Campylobacter]|uniref:hypothetical protein n=1 Tax=unclassified Campylobacter TaxID=2593542 RepID=UPI001B8C8304|nr:MULTISPECIES: hypothetical protein [unclassified Campylobacter]
MKEIKSRSDLINTSSFSKESLRIYNVSVATNSNLKYDLIGKLVEETGLTRKAVIQILQGMEESVFNQFKDNPEEFIIRVAGLINDEKATAIIEHITYNVMDERYDTTTDTLHCLIFYC